MKKKITAFLVTVFMLSAAMLFVNILPPAKESINLFSGDEFALGIEVKLQETNYLFKWWQSETARENDYHIALPSVMKGRKHTVRIHNRESIVLNGKEYTDGQAADNIREGLNSIVARGKERNLYIYYTSDIPSVHITTETGSIDSIKRDKNYREKAIASVLDSSGTVYSGELEYIKGRGNGSWNFPQQGFNIKFAAKVNLFGMGRAKKWALVTTYRDDTRMKNAVAFEMADIMGHKNNVQLEFTDVFINGEYMGLYQLTEKVEIASERIDIFDLEKRNEQEIEDLAYENLQRGIIFTQEGTEHGQYKWLEFPNEPSVIDGGYILECDYPNRYWPVRCGFTSMYGQPVVLKDPQFISRRQVEYIYNYYQSFEDGVLSADGLNKEGIHYSEYMDIQSMSKVYIIQEWSKNLDAGVTSFYLQKDVGGKLEASRVWDFDTAFGYDFYRNGDNIANPENLWAGNMGIFHRETTKTIPTLLWQQRDFRRMVNSNWNRYILPNMNRLMEFIDMTGERIEKSACIENIRWNGDTITDYEKSAADYENSVDKLKDFITKRRDYLTGYFDSAQ